MRSHSYVDIRKSNAQRRTELLSHPLQFGAGYMSCPGQNVARIELSKITATIVRDYDIRQVDMNKEWKYKAYFTVVPHSWPCLIQKRQT